MPNLNAEQLRELGFQAIQQQKWTAALTYLNLSARYGRAMDLSLLDALGHAAYKCNTPEALAPYQNFFKHPQIATHMARAFMMIGDVAAAKEFLGFAEESGLKAALTALMRMDANFENFAEEFITVAARYPHLDYPEFWRSLAAVADSLNNERFTKIAEVQSQAHAWCDPNIHFNQALRMLGKKEFVAGWSLYEARLIPGCKNPNRTELGNIPMWEGESLAGKTLLIFLEQGLGDCIFSLRYISLMEKEGAKIEIVARKPLLDLIRSSFPSVKIRDEDDVAACDYWSKNHPHPDLWTYSLSIPARGGHFKPVNTQAFLRTEAVPANAQLKKLNQPVYTINWHGRIETESDRTRSYTAQQFLESSGLLSFPCTIISLQMDAKPSELDLLKNMVVQAGGRFIDAAAHIKTFTDTARWILQSDRLVTCDTSVAHLGGALGHPTTVLVRNKAIWQWTIHEDEVKGDGPFKALWYDSVEVIYRLVPKHSWLYTLPENQIQVISPTSRRPRRPVRFCNAPTFASPFSDDKLVKSHQAEVRT